MRSYSGMYSIKKQLLSTLVGVACVTATVVFINQDEAPESAPGVLIVKPTISSPSKPLSFAVQKATVPRLRRDESASLGATLAEDVERSLGLERDDYLVTATTPLFEGNIGAVLDADNELHSPAEIDSTVDNIGPFLDVDNESYGPTEHDSAVVNIGPNMDVDDIASQSMLKDGTPQYLGEFIDVDSVLDDG